MTNSLPHIKDNQSVRGSHNLDFFLSLGWSGAAALTSPFLFMDASIVRNTKYDVLITIQAIIKAHHTNWCYASRLKTLELLAKYHNLKIGNRMLGYHLADLRDAGLIKTYRRTHREADGTICLLTAARCLTIKGCKYLLLRGVTWAQHHLNKLKLKYIPPQPGKPFDEEKYPDRDFIPAASGKNPFLDPGHRRRLGLPDAPPFDPKKT